MAAGTKNASKSRSGQRSRGNEASTRHVTKSTRKTGQAWTSDDVKSLKMLAKENTPTRVIGVKLQRSEAAVRSKAKTEGISLKPVNRSPYDRRAR